LIYSIGVHRDIVTIGPWFSKMFRIRRSRFWRLETRWRSKSVSAFESLANALKARAISRIRAIVRVQISSCRSSAFKRRFSSRPTQSPDLLRANLLPFPVASIDKNIRYTESALHADVARSQIRRKTGKTRRL